VTSANIDRLDVYLDERPLQSLAIRSAAVSVGLPRNLQGATHLRLFGFDGRKLAVATRVRL
jgi:hypothetical protein